MRNSMNIIMIKECFNKYDIISLIEFLQDYLAEIDPLGLTRRLTGFGEKYAQVLIDRIFVKGNIFVAYNHEEAVGMIAAEWLDIKEVDNLGSLAQKPARILELVVKEEYRGQKIGRLLMEAAENHYYSQGCDLLRVEVFVPNRNAYEFYKHFGYEERVVDMVKPCSKAK